MNGFLWIDRERFHAAFVADATDTEAAVMAAVQKPLAIAAFTGVSGPPAWKMLPSWYLQCTDDQMIPPPAQAFMAERMGATVRSVAGQPRGLHGASRRRRRDHRARLLSAHRKDKLP